MHTISNVNDSPIEYQFISAVQETNSDSVPSALVNHEACATGDSISILTAPHPKKARIPASGSARQRHCGGRKRVYRRMRSLRSGSRDLSVLPRNDRIVATSTYGAPCVLGQTHDHVDTLCLLDSHQADAVFKTIRLPSIARCATLSLT